MKLPIDYTSAHWTERKQAREEYIKIQKGLCHFCGESLSASPRKDIEEKSINWRLFPKNFMQWPVHLHHDHTTGLTIGAVHAKCNAVLWQYYGE